jgi:hypothetical protein
MDSNKVNVAILETIGVSLTPYIMYLENVTPIFTFLSAIVGTVYITIKAYKEIKKK